MWQYVGDKWKYVGEICGNMWKYGDNKAGDVGGVFTDYEIGSVILKRREVSVKT